MTSSEQPITHGTSSKEGSPATGIPFPPLMAPNTGSFTKYGSPPRLPLPTLPSISSLDFPHQAQTVNAKPVPPPSLLQRSSLPAMKSEMPKPNVSVPPPVASPPTTATNVPSPVTSSPPRADDHRPNWEAYGNHGNPASSQPPALTEFLKVPRCAACLVPLTPDVPANIYYGNAYHESCLRYFIGHMSYQGMMAPIPTAEPVDAYRVNSEEIVEVPDEIEVSITTHPASFQIANYNIHPAPILSFNMSLPSSLNISVTLVESVTGTEVAAGFQTGATRTLYPGSKMIYFTGLKLNKMGKLKADLHDKQLDTFFLKFQLGSRTITSNSFKVVSSCSRVPGDIKEAVRPPKRTSSVKGTVARQDDSDSQGEERDTKSQKKSKK